MQFVAILARTALLVLLASVAARAAADSVMVRYPVKSDFDTVKDNLEMAITNQGLVITSESHINEMLERTGTDLGLGGPIYKDAVAFEFCSARFSRLMMAADPHNIVFCPFVIAVYQPVTDADTVYVAYRRPGNSDSGDAAQQALEQVAEFLDTIATEAAEGL